MEYIKNIVNYVTSLFSYGNYNKFNNIFYIIKYDITESLNKSKLEDYEIEILSHNIFLLIIIELRTIKKYKPCDIMRNHVHPELDNFINLRKFPEIYINQVSMNVLRKFRNYRNSYGHINTHIYEDETYEDIDLLL
jgi:hypothetical protein